jgi:serine protease Do
MRGGAAEKAGLKVNDCIIAADGKPIDSPDDLINLLLTRKPGDVIELKVKRGEEELELKATLGKRPASANRGDMQNRLGSELSRRRTGFPTILQHDAVIKPSDCGGPVVNLDGKTIGINIARAGRTESYAIPTEAIRPLLKDLMSGKLAPLPKEEPKKPVSG